MKLNTAFECQKCGACCSHLEQFHGVYDKLDRGDGVCMYFDETKSICTIYHNRPALCRVEEGFQIVSSIDNNEMTWEVYIEETKKACKYLQSLNKK